MKKVQINLDIALDDAKVHPERSAYQLAVEFENLAESKDGVQQAVATIRERK